MIIALGSAATGMNSVPMLYSWKSFLALQTSLRPRPRTLFRYFFNRIFGLCLVDWRHRFLRQGFCVLQFLSTPLEFSSSDLITAVFINCQKCIRQLQVIFPYADIETDRHSGIRDTLKQGSKFCLVPLERKSRTLSPGIKSLFLIDSVIPISNFATNILYFKWAWLISFPEVR